MPLIGIASARAGNVIGGGDWAKDRIIPDCIRNLELKKFEFKDYPRFISERDEFGKLGAYAWKSIIIEETLSDVDEGLVLWLDAGNKITSSLDRLKKVILQQDRCVTH